MSVQEPADAERVRQVAELARNLGMRVQAIIVGDVKLVFSEPWPKSESAVPAQVSEIREDARTVDPKLGEARKRSQALFGRPLTDDVLRQLEGVL